MEIAWQVGIRQAPRPSHTCLLDTDDSHGKHFGLRFLISHLTPTHNSPGRFFATLEMKVLLAHVVITYDLKLEEGKKVPRTVCIATSRIIRNADVLFRKRQK
jgi:hypothetical protein